MDALYQGVGPQSDEVILQLAHPDTISIREPYKEKVNLVTIEKHTGVYAFLIA